MLNESIYWKRGKIAYASQSGPKYSILIKRYQVPFLFQGHEKRSDRRILLKISLKYTSNINIYFSVTKSINFCWQLIFETIHNFAVMEVLINFSIQTTCRKSMQTTSQIMIQHEWTKPTSQGSWTRVRIANGSVDNDYDARMEEKNVVFKMKEKSYIIHPNTKMEPIYSQDHKITCISLSLNSHEMKITAQNYQQLQTVYLSLKRQISHKGFNEYFKPLKRLGKGSFATVYLVQHKYTGEKLAAKVFSRQSQKISYMGHEALLNEIRMLKTLDHPNIIRFDGLYQTENLIYLVTQYLSGGTLTLFIRNKSSLMGDFITKILSDTLHALKYLQQRNIMHRDFKPQNIMMRQSDQKWVLVDFGLAAYSNQKYLYDKCGTMGYIAPQILDQNQEEKTYNSSCDVYSLGVVSYNLIVGCLPFKVEGGMFDRKMIWDAFTKPEAVGLDEEILNLLGGLLEKDPSKRLTAAEALSTSFFNDPMVIESWKIYNKNRNQETYHRVLKTRNN